MQKVITGAVLTSLAALAGPVQGEVAINESTQIDLAVFVPCANQGNGELVELHGPLHTLITFITNGNNLSGKTHFQPQGISGIGIDTGDRYQGAGVTQDHFKSSLTKGQFNQTFVNNFRIIGQGPGNNFVLHENFHLTINANGEVTTVHDNFDVDCK